MTAPSHLSHASIHLASSDLVTAFTAQELQRYLLAMTGACLPVVLEEEIQPVFSGVNVE